MSETSQPLIQPSFTVQSESQRAVKAEVTKETASHLQNRVAENTKQIGHKVNISPRDNIAICRLRLRIFRWRNQRKKHPSILCSQQHHYRGKARPTPLKLERQNKVQNRRLR